MSANMPVHPIPWLKRPSSHHLGLPTRPRKSLSSKRASISRPVLDPALLHIATPNRPQACRIRPCLVALHAVRRSAQKHADTRHDIREQGNMHPPHECTTKKSADKCAMLSAGAELRVSVVRRTDFRPPRRRAGGGGALRLEAVRRDSGREVADELRAEAAVARLALCSQAGPAGEPEASWFQREPKRKKSPSLGVLGRGQVCATYKEEERLSMHAHIHSNHA